MMNAAGGFEKSVFSERVVRSGLAGVRTATGIGGDETFVHVFVFFPDPLEYTDPDGEGITNFTQNWVLLRAENGTTIPLEPNGIYDKNIDGVMIYDGTTFKIHDHNADASMGVLPLLTRQV